MSQGQPAAGKSDGGPSACASCERLRRELEATRGTLRKSQARAAELEAQLGDLRRSVFGRKSEAATPGRDDPPGGSRSNPAGAGSPRPTGGRERSAREARGPGRAHPAAVEKRPDVPVAVERLDVPESDRRCPCCGTAYVPCGYKISWLYEIDWKALARKLLRQRYRPACAAARPVIAAPAARLGPTQLGISVWAWCLVQVYALFRPQAAVARDLQALGLRVPLSTLSQGLRRLSHLCEALDAAIARRQRQAAVAQADETSWPVQYIAGCDGNKDPPPARGQRKPKFWLWVCLAAGTARMRILPTRGADSGAQLLEVLGGNGPAILMCDRYSAYKAFARLYPDKVVVVYCWAHVRRDYVRIGTGYPELQAWSEGWIKRIGRVFHLERRRQAWQPGLPLERQRPEFDSLQQQLQAAVDELFRSARKEGGERSADWTRLSGPCGRQGGELARVNAQGKALASLLKHEDGLRRFVSDPRIPLENNAAERALRGPVIARYTSFGAGGPDGARAAGLRFGVFETLRMAGLNPYTVMLDWLAACARRGGQAPQNLDPWLPWRMSEQRRQELPQAA